MITKEEFNQWREWLRTDSSLKPPEIFTSNYWHWNCRAFLARCMVRDKFYEPALRMMETVVEQIPEPDDQYAWALSDLGCFHWRVHRDKEKALYYLNKSLEVLDNTKDNREEMIFFSEGGKYLSYKLKIIEQAGGLDQAKEEALKEIARYQEKYPEVKLNSYVFHGYLFLAELEKKQQQFDKAINYMKEGLAASEYADECTQICEDTSLSGETLYTRLVELSHSMLEYFEV